MTDTPASLRAGARLLFLLLVLVVLVSVTALVVAPATAQAHEAHEVHATSQPVGDHAGQEATATHGTEPSTWLLLGTGLAIILLLHHRRHRQRQRGRRSRQSRPLAADPVQPDLSP